MHDYKQVKGIVCLVNHYQHYNIMYATWEFCETHLIFLSLLIF